MKFDLRIKVGVDGGEGIGISHKTFPFKVEADTLQDAMTKALQEYVAKFGREPNTFPAFKLELALDASGQAATPAAPQAPAEAGQGEQAQQ